MKIELSKLILTSILLKLYRSQTHTGRKFYRCSYCEMEFTRNTSRRRHEKVIHEEPDMHPKRTGMVTKWEERLKY